MNLNRLLALLKPKPKPRPIYVGDVFVGWDDGLPNSVKIDKEKLLEAIAPTPWIGRIMPFFGTIVSNSQEVATGNLDSAVFRYWHDTRWLEINNGIGAANANQVKTYLYSFHAYKFGTFRWRCYNVARESGRSFYPLMFETPIGGHMVPPPSGDYAGAIIISDLVTATQWLCGYAGSSSYANFTGWDPTVEDELKIEWTSAQVNYYTGGTLRASSTTNVPQCPLCPCFELRQDGSATAYSARQKMYVRDFEKIA